MERTNDCVTYSHPILRKIEDFADSPLVPALLEKVHLESDPVMLKVSAPSLLRSRRKIRIWD